MATEFKNKFWILGILVVLGIWGNWNVVWDQDEAAYFGFSKTMMETQNYLIPDFPFSDPHRKPPLHFWIVSFFFKIFGASSFVLRLSSVLFSFGTLFLTYCLANLLQKNSNRVDSLTKDANFASQKENAFPNRNLLKDSFQTSTEGIFAVIILATFPLFLVPMKIAFVDSTLVIFKMLGIYFAFAIHLGYSRWNWLGFYLALSLGALVKGPPVYISCMGILGFVILLKKFQTPLFSFWHILGIPLSLVPLFTWGYFAYNADGGKFITWLINWYVLRRASDPVFGQSGPPGTYFLLFSVFLFPWSFYFFRIIAPIFSNLKNSIANLFSKTKKQTNDVKLFFGAWFLSSWIFYELMASKLPSYILSVLPAFAILLSQYCNSKLFSEKLKKWELAWGVIGGILFTGIFVVLPQLEYMQTETYLYLGAILSLGLASFFLYRLFQNSLSTKLLISTALVTSVLLIGGILPAFEEVKKESFYFSKILKTYSPKQILFSFNPRWPSLAVHSELTANKVQILEDPNLLLKTFLSSNETMMVVDSDWEPIFLAQGMKEPSFRFQLHTYDTGKTLNLSIYYRK